MNENTQMLLDAAQRAFERNFNETTLLRAETGEWLSEGWAAIEDFGAPLALLTEEQGGFGLPASDALQIVRLAAEACVPMPVGEAMVANWLLAQTGLPIGEGPLTVAPVEPADTLHLSREGEGANAQWRLTGTAHRVPWGRVADMIVVVAHASDGPKVVRVARAAASITEGANMARHFRDDLVFDAVIDASHVAPLPTGFDADVLLLVGAAVRAVGMSGALNRILDIAVTYANDRVQFGRPIGKFQAVQQNLAKLADEVAAASAAASMAASAFEQDLAPLAIAVAKSRAGEAAGTGASIAHQVLGAIGFTREHALNTLTRPAWSWRDEFGREAFWNQKLGVAASQAGERGLWPLITRI